MAYLYTRKKVARCLGDPNNPPTNYEIDPAPKFNYGISTSVTFKNWSANIFFRGVSGQKIFNNTNLNLGNYSRIAAQHNMLSEAFYGPVKDFLHSLPIISWRMLPT